MRFTAENSRSETRVNFSWTIYLQGPVVSMICRSELYEIVDIMIFYSIIHFKLTIDTVVIFNPPALVSRPTTTAVKAHH